jgi:signal peptidase II
MAYVLTALIVFILDQLSKSYVIANYELHNSNPVIKNILSITYSTNTGGAFSILSKCPAFFIIISILLMTLAIVYLRLILAFPLYYQFSLGLILGGAAGNLADRLRFGSVIDFIDFSFWPTFNVADIAISVGVGIMVLNLIIYRDKENSTKEITVPPAQEEPAQIESAQGAPAIAEPAIEEPTLEDKQPITSNQAENPPDVQKEPEKYE